MKLVEIVDRLSLKEVTEVANLDVEVTGGITCDLLSNVMGNAEEGMIWVTMQGHQNIAAIASLLSLSAIVVADNSSIEEETISKANKNGVAIFTTPMTSFVLTGKIYELGIGKL